MLTATKTVNDILPAEYWLQQMWGKIRLCPDQEFPATWSKGSGRKFKFICECGRVILISFYKIPQSCGKCSFLPQEHWKTMRWSSLVLDPEQELPAEWAPKSTRRFVFICDCGKKTTTAFQNVSSGHSITCGNCTAKPKEYWCSQIWGKLSLDLTQELPEIWPPGYNHKFWFICQGCQKRFQALFANVTSGKTQSCGHCTNQPRDYWLAQKWGKLKLVKEQNLPEAWPPQYEVKVLCQCDCGRVSRVMFSSLTRAINTKSCGNCTAMSKEHWLSCTWGKLRLDPNQELPMEGSPQSVITVICNCECGRNAEIPFNRLNSGAVTCNRCTFLPKDYWLKQKWGELTLDPNQELPEEWAPYSGYKFRFLCNGCSGTTEIYFYTVHIAKSCGCLHPGESEFSTENEVRKFVLSLAPDTYPGSYPIPGSRKSYDIYTPSNKFAVEYHGLIWHSEKFGEPKREYGKFLLATSRGDRLIQIYQDEWEHKQEIMKAQIQEILVPIPKTRIRPTYEIVQGKTPSEAREFLDTNHYLGAASGCLTILAKYKEAIVGVWVFMKREKDTVIWHRVCWDRHYRTWNPHQKALNLALPILKEMGFTKIVSFSDNRFHTGDLYEKLGFVMEEELKPDYGYTNGFKRVSKYALRVKAGVDEVQAAMSKGWYRIWDSGKKRYTYMI